MFTLHTVVPFARELSRKRILLFLSVYKGSSFYTLPQKDKLNKMICTYFLLLGSFKIIVACSWKGIQK